jgi:hypothetical protein
LNESHSAIFSLLEDPLEPGHDGLDDLANPLLRGAEYLGDLARRVSLKEERKNDLLPLFERRTRFSRPGQLLRHLVCVKDVTDDASRHASADAAHVRAEVQQDLGAYTLALADQPKQKMLGPDVAMAKLQGLSE